MDVRKELTVGRIALMAAERVARIVIKYWWVILLFICINIFYMNVLVPWGNRIDQAYNDYQSTFGVSAMYGNRGGTISKSTFKAEQNIVELNNYSVVSYIGSIIKGKLVWPFVTNDGANITAVNSNFGSGKGKVSEDGKSIALRTDLTEDELGYHNGVDINAISTPIIAPYDCVVISNGWITGGGWNVTIKSVESDVYTRLMHMAYKPDLQVGQKLNAGDRIGTTGKTGDPRYAIHGHYEVWVGYNPNLGAGVGPTKEYAINPLSLYSNLNFTAATWDVGLNGVHIEEKPPTTPEKR